MTWAGDCIAVKLPRHKGDQAGARSYPKHCYANPNDPMVCLFLRLGLHIACTYKTADSNHNVFVGATTESKFSKWLHTALTSLGTGVVMLIGFIASLLGTHSFRKGSATYGQSFNGGPTVVAVFHRAGWSLGNVPNRYLFPTISGDQLLGRVVCGLPWMQEDFAVLPPHFKTDTEISDTEWETLVPGYQNYPDCFKPCIPFLVASVIYHISWCRSKLPAGDPFFTSRLNRDQELIDRLQPCVITGKFFCEDTHMVATGIPENLKNALKTEELIVSMEKMKLQARQDREELREMLETEVPEKIVAQLRARLEINGMVSVTASDLQQMQTVMTSQLQQHTEQLSTMMQQQLSNGASSASNAPQIAPLSVARVNPYYWGDRYHPVPEGYEFATVSTKTLWDLWLHGSSSSEAPLGPLRYIQPKCDISGNSNNIRFSRAKKVMCSILAYCVDCPNWKTIQDMTNREADEKFEVALLTLLGDQVADRNTARLFELSYLTIYKMLPKINNNNNNDE